MEEMVIIAENQKVTPEDFNNFGQFPRNSIDHVVKDGITSGKGYVGFPVVQSAPAEVTVGAGRFYNEGPGYFRDDDGGYTIDMISNLPAVAKRKVLIVVWGQTLDDDLEPRTFLINPETFETQGQETATVSRRIAQIGALYGVENATPQAPAVDANYLAVAELVLTTTGIEADSIKMLTANRLPSAKANSDAIAVITTRLNGIGPELDTAKSNISGLGAALRTKADRRMVADIAFNLAEVKDKLDLPDDYVAWGADHLLDDARLDSGFSGYAAYINDGGRYPHASSATTNLALANALDPSVIVNDNMVLPAFTHTKRLSVTGKDGEYSLADTTIETTNVVQLMRSRTVREYIGSERTTWGSLLYNGQDSVPGTWDPIKRCYVRDGETWEVYAIRAWEDEAVIGIRQFVERTIEEPYMDRVTTTTSVSGAILGQTFLNGADGYLTKVGVFFTRRANSGNVRLAICETTAAGAPNLDRVLIHKEILNADIVANLNGDGETLVSITPTVLLKGRRYAAVLISNAAHFVAKIAGNKLASGALFYSQDGQFVQRPADEDIPINLYFAEFAAAQVAVQLAPLTLAGGIDRIRVNCDFTQLDGCKVEFQGLVTGIWRSFSEDDTLLTTRPDLMQMRAVFIGTKDVMPALGIGAGRSSVLVSRPAGARTIITDPFTIPSSDEIIVRVRYDNWDAAYNASTVTVLTGVGYATVETADATTTSVPPDDSDAIIREYTFNLAGAVTSFRVKIAGTTSDTHFCDVVRKYAFVAYP